VIGLISTARGKLSLKSLLLEESAMARKGTAGKTPEKHVGAPESGIDKAINKTKEVFDGENEATDYEEVKGKEEMKDAKEHSKKVANKKNEDSERNI